MSNLIYERMITISISTLKGGQGKTFLSALLCRELASMNQRVLAISLCSQNDINLALNGKVGKNQLYEAFKNNMIAPAIIKTNVVNVDLVPYDINSSESVDILLQVLKSGDNRLKILLKQVENEYDYAILDTGPNLGLTTVAAIVASDYVISPMTMTWSGYNGYIATSNAIDEMKDLGMTACQPLGIVRSCTNVNRDTETFEVEDQLIKDQFPELGTIPKSSAVKSALLEQKSYDAVKKHHLDQMKNTLNNILKHVACQSQIA